jgi:hypothetical protein
MSSPAALIVYVPDERAVLPGNAGCPISADIHEDVVWADTLPGPHRHTITINAAQAATCRFICIGVRLDL